MPKEKSFEEQIAELEKIIEERVGAKTMGFGADIKSKTEKDTGEVFEQLLTDKTLAMIAQELYISHSAVHFHCKNIYKKLGISNRRQFLITYKDLYQ